MIKFVSSPCRRTTLTIDHAFLFLLSLSFIYNLAILYPPSFGGLRQLDTFDDLKENVIECPSGNAGYRENNNSSSEVIRCPVDEDRLRYLDDYKLNTWLYYHHIEFGGRFRPVGCLAKQTIAIIIPFREAQEELERFILYLHQFLPDQLIDYTVYVIEQLTDSLFNQPKLSSIGAIEIRKLRDDICCFVFHDLNMMPLDQKNLYMCSKSPKHLSPGLSTRRYHLSNPESLEGVVAMTTEQYDTVSGYLGDVGNSRGLRRIMAADYHLERAPLAHGLYLANKHDNDDIIYESDYQSNSAIEASYSLEKIEYNQLYTKISINLI